MARDRGTVAKRSKGHGLRTSDGVKALIDLKGSRGIDIHLTHPCQRVAYDVRLGLARSGLWPPNNRQSKAMAGRSVRPVTGFGARQNCPTAAHQK